MSSIQQKATVKEFVERWLNEPGNEEEQSRSFWIQLLEEVLGVKNATHVLQFERKVKGRKIDVFYEDMGILIEQKGRGVSLDEATVRSAKVGPETPYQQACWYANNLPYSVRPRWIITCNFDEIRIYDQDQEDTGKFETVLLKDLAEESYRLSFFTDKKNSRIEKEKQLSFQAGEIVGRLYNQLSTQYKNIETDKHEQYSLNVLIVRLVFLLYAEDAQLLQRKDAFLDYMRQFDSHQMRTALIDLFEVLDTPIEERDPYLPEDLLAFPYVNGGLYSKNIDVVVPQFTDQIRLDLLLEASQKFNWSKISPTIFGAVFESTLNPETRRAGGMHYTSIENIHKVIDPLFLNDLKKELEEIEGKKQKSEKTRIIELRNFQKKLANINILDPACGSGNFLTESYLSLRKLENRVIESLQGGGQLSFDIETDSLIQVSISQFYGIEINDFAVSVAKTALWIAEEQMLDITQEITLVPFDFFPLKSNSNIREGNALRMDWNEVLPAEKCSYICGNPPFVGSSLRTKQQTEDMEAIAFAGRKKWGKVDYCGAWYYMSALYMEGNKNILAALVSTNSLCQGEQVEPMWKDLFDKGIRISFAYRTFIWDSEATDKAHVHCLIIGFSYTSIRAPFLVSENGNIKQDGNINGYLYFAPSVFIPARGRAIDSLHKAIVQGSKPVDGGGLIVEPGDYDNFAINVPGVIPCLRLYVGSEEFIKNKKRYVLYLKGAPEELLQNPVIKERLETVRQQRLSSPTAEFRKFADKPWLFVQDRQPRNRYLIIPQVSSERRKYIPIGYLSPDVVVSNAAYCIPGASLYDFGLVSSGMHNAWMRVVAGRLKSDYRYSPIVYNSFAYPESNEDCQKRIEKHAKAVLDARDKYPDKSLADLYDPDKMPDDLRAAHDALDKAVEEAYGVDFNGDEEKIVAHLFNLYAQMTEGK